MNATIPFLHAPYLGDTAPDGYPQNQYQDPPTPRLAFLIQPDTENVILTDTSHADRITVRKLVGVPTVAPFKVWDKITVSGEVFILKEVRDMSTSPFPLPFGQPNSSGMGALIIERVVS